jgi:hypothetical protein
LFGKTNLAIGTASPIKHSGARKAVMLPAKILVANMMISLDFYSSNPDYERNFLLKAARSKALC